MRAKSFNRQLSSALAQEVLTVLHQAGFAELKEADVIHAGEVFAHVEQSITGRIAGHLEDYLGMFLATRAACGARGRDPVHMVEIGTLFGGSAALLWLAAKESGATFSLTAIDPLDGYYRHSSTGPTSPVDIITGLDISAARVRSNLVACGVPEDGVKIVCALSNEPAALAAASVRPIDILFIDGDHSLEGLTADFKNYLPLMRTGGLMVLDNFTDMAWPDVTRATLRWPEFPQVLQPLAIIRHSLLCRYQPGAAQTSPALAAYARMTERALDNAMHDARQVLDQNLLRLTGTICQQLEGLEDFRARAEAISKLRDAPAATTKTTASSAPAPAAEPWDAKFSALYKRADAVLVRLGLDRTFKASADWQRPADLTPEQCAALAGEMAEISSHLKQALARAFSQLAHQSRLLALDFRRVQRRHQRLQQRLNTLQAKFDSVVKTRAYRAGRSLRLLPDVLKPTPAPTPRA
jgi:hypothetical protein